MGLKEKSYYEIMKERIQEGARELPVTPTEVSQTILWLKGMAIERIENIDKKLLGNEKVYTFRARGVNEISVSQSMKLNEQGVDTKFGFSEQYVNLLMHHAYEAGVRKAQADYKASTANMLTTLKEIAGMTEEYL